MTDRSSDARLLEVRGLSVGYESRAGTVWAVEELDFHVDAGETLAIVGESGSGKSTAAMAVSGLLGSEATVTGSADLLGRDVISAPEAERRRRRGVDVGIVFQDPFTSLNPGLRIGRQVTEGLVHHRRVAPDEARRRAIDVLGEVGLQEPEQLLELYPHQLSGGMQQRVLIASALICDPKFLVLDEPTTALDVTIEARILDLLDDIRRRRGLGMLFITHNLGVVNRIADRVCVLYSGRVAEMGAKDDVLAMPRHPYTKGLLASLPMLEANRERRALAPIPGRMPQPGDRGSGCVFRPRCPYAETGCDAPQALVGVAEGHAVRCWKSDAVAGRPWPVERKRNGGDTHPGDAPSADPLLVAQDLRKTFRGAALRKTAWRWRFGIPLPYQPRRMVRAINGVSLEIMEGEVLGLVGESGSGKSTLGQAIVRLLGIDSGKVLFEGRDVTTLAEERDFRSKAQVVFQNPDSSLNPRRAVGAAIARAVSLHASVPRGERRARVEALLDRVGLPRSFYDRYPHQLSGGERQRVGIARALATRPRFILCDEPTSALDVSVQATVLNVLADLRAQEGLSYLFISHDLSVVAHISDRIAVMYAGGIVETGTTAQVLAPPFHPYTEALLSAIPRTDPGDAGRERIALRSDTPGGAEGMGCPFSGRCPRRIGSVCDEVVPPVRTGVAGHRIMCHIPLEDLAASQAGDETPPDAADHRPDGNARR
jgi:peptide/nickel transport system ATP-binding protein